MKDHEIIALFFERSERAITELINKYGAAIKNVASNILKDAQDAEEAANDTYLTVWNRIPPTRPKYLGAYSGTHVYYLELDPNQTLVADLFADDISTPVDDDLTAADIAALPDFSPKFYASVVQSNGFATTEKAWESLENNHSRNP